MTPQPAPASAGEESEEDQQFRTIFQEIAGDVSLRETKRIKNKQCSVFFKLSWFTIRKSINVCGKVVIQIILMISSLLLLFLFRTWKSQPTNWKTFSTEWSPNVSPVKSVFTLSLQKLTLDVMCDASFYKKKCCSFGSKQRWRRKLVSETRLIFSNSFVFLSVWCSRSPFASVLSYFYIDFRIY